MNRKTYWRILTEDIFRNKTFLFFVIFTTILCFGFTITNFSIGVDDSARVPYLYSTESISQISQGRLTHVLLNRLTGTVDFIPFFNDFLAASLFCLSAILFCALFQYVTDSKLSTVGLTSFACVYLSHSVINEKFIYNLDVVVVMLAYCSTAISLAFSYDFLIRKKVPSFVHAATILMIALGAYESFPFLYFCGVFVIFILRIVINDEKINLRTLILDGLYFAAILITAMILYYSIVHIVQTLTYQTSLRSISWRTILSNFPEITKNIVQDLAHTDYFPKKEIAFFSILGGVLFVYHSIKKRNPWLVLCYFALLAGNLMVHYIFGSIVCRAAQTFCLFIGFIILILISKTEKKPTLKKALLTCTVLLVIAQSADMNRHFYNDYCRYQKEAHVVHSIATDLVAECDITKPIVFLNFQYGGYLDTWLYPYGGANGHSVLYWGTGFGDETTPMMYELFRLHGYQFLLAPTLEQAKQAAIEAIDMPCWPQNGYVRELDDYIIVKMGNDSQS